MELDSGIEQGFNFLVWAISKINWLLNYPSNFLAELIQIAPTNALIITQLIFSLGLSWTIVKDKGVKLLIVTIIIFMVLYKIG